MATATPVGAILKDAQVNAGVNHVAHLNMQVITGTDGTTGMPIYGAGGNIADNDVLVLCFSVASQGANPHIAAAQLDGRLTLVDTQSVAGHTSQIYAAALLASDDGAPITIVTDTNVWGGFMGVILRGADTTLLPDKTGKMIQTALITNLTAVPAASGATRAGETELNFGNVSGSTYSTFTIPAGFTGYQTNNVAVTGRVNQFVGIKTAPLANGASGGGAVYNGTTSGTPSQFTVLVPGLPTSPPTVSFTARLRGKALSVAVTAVPVSPATIASYDVDWGDTTAHGAAASPPAHTYAAAGEKTVTVKVTDSVGAFSTAVLTVTVGNASTQPGVGPLILQSGWGVVGAADGQHALNDGVNAPSTSTYVRSSYAPDGTVIQYFPMLEPTFTPLGRAGETLLVDRIGGSAGVVQIALFEDTTIRSAWYSITPGTGVENSAIQVVATAGANETLFSIYVSASEAANVVDWKKAQWGIKCTIT